MFVRARIGAGLAVAVLAATGADAARASCVGAPGCPYRTVQQIGSADPLRFQRIAGLAMDAQDTLYVADAGTGQIAVFDAGGTLRQRLSRFGTAPDQLASPQAISLAPDGTLTVGDLGTVKQLAPSGALLRSWPVRGIRDLSVDPAGTTWTADGTSVAAYAPLGDLTGQWRVGVPDSPAFASRVAAGSTRVFVGASNGFYGFGDVVIPSGSSGGVYGLTPGGSPVFSPPCVPGFAIDRSGEPLCGEGPIAADPDGSLWLPETHGTLAHIDKDGQLLGRLAITPSFNQNSAYWLAELAVSPTGRLALATSDGRIAIHRPGEGTPLFTLGHGVTEPRHLGYPSAVAVGRDHSIFVADGEDTRIKQFTSRGRLLQTWGLAVPRVGPETEFTGLSVSRTGDLVAATRTTVFVRSASGRPRRSFAVPEGIDQLALGADGLIYALHADSPSGDRYEGEVLVYTVRGRLVRHVRLGRVRKNPRPNVTDMVLDARGRIYLSDAKLFAPPLFAGRDTVSVFSPRGRLLRSISARNPRAVAVDASGVLYVVASDPPQQGAGPTAAGASRVAVYARNGRRLRTIGVTGFGLGEFRIPSGLAVDHVGKQTVLVVADRGNHRIQRLTLSR